MTLLAPPCRIADMYYNTYMKSLPATRVRSDLFNVIKTAVRTHEPVGITSRAGDAVLLSKSDFEDLMETLELLSTPGVLAGVRKAKKDIKAGRTYSLAQLFGS
jgi:antitoxin YefM